MENMHSEVIANRTYSLTALSLTRHKEYRYNNCRRVRRVTVLSRTSSAANGHTSAASECELITQLRCRTNQMFTECCCYYYYFSWSSLPLTTISHHYFHPKHFSLSYFQRNKLLVLFLVLSILSNRIVVTANPIHHQRWTNPCNMNKLPGQLNLDWKSHFAMTQYQMISQNAEMTREETIKVKDKFITATFGNVSFLKEFDWMSFDWLPKIPSTSEPHINHDKVAHLLKHSYEYMQHYAVAIDQIVLDQVTHDGDYVADFRKIEENIRLILCELQVTIMHLNTISPKDISKDIMSDQYRDIDSEVTRNVRDYIIMRDLITGLDFIGQEFKKIHRHEPTAFLANDDAK